MNTEIQPGCGFEHDGKPMAHGERELTALRAVASACTHELDEDLLLDRVTEIICEALSIDNFGVLLLDPETGLFHDHRSARRRPGSEALYLRFGEGIVGTVAMTGRPMRISNVHLEPLYRMGDPESCSELTVPLQVGGQILGVISCESPKLNAFTEEDERLLVILAGYVATSLGRLRNTHIIREQEKKYRAIFENSGHPMIFVEEDSIISICNKACEDLAGCPKGEIEGRKKWMDFVAYEEDLTRIMEYRQARWVDPNSVPSLYEYIFRPIKGDLKHVSAAVNVIPGTHKVLVVITDITERKRMESALLASERRYHALFNNVPVGLYQVTPDGRCIEANRSLVEMRGFSDLVFFMQHPTSTCYARTEDYEAWRRELEEKGSAHREMEWKRQDGSTFWVDERARIHHDLNGQVYFDGSVVDISDRKQAEVESDFLRQRLQQSEKFEAIGQLAGGVAHDFNNQLTIIMGFADALADMATNEIQKRYVLNIAKSCQRSAELTKQLLAFARKGKLLSVPSDFHGIISEVVALVGCSFDKRIQLRHHLDAERSQVLGDPTQLQNALMNIAINARDAMPEGGELTFRSRIRELTKEECTRIPYEVSPGTFLEVRIEDTGIGMDAETQRRVFEPFFTTKELGKGTGLGMASVYGTVKQHKGMIQIESELGRGTCIILTFPLTDVSMGKPIAVPSNKFIKGDGHIVIVDDEDLVVDMFREILVPLKYQVTTFQDPVEALEFYREAHKSVDLVILDIMMPRMGGEDLFLAMQVINPAVKVILVSGFSVEGEAQRMLNAGVRGFLQKPFRKLDLVQELQKVLHG
jgi:PAS domain S-box-containing protein